MDSKNDESTDISRLVSEMLEENFDGSGNPYNPLKKVQTHYWKKGKKADTIAVVNLTWDYMLFLRIF